MERQRTTDTDSMTSRTTDFVARTTPATSPAARTVTGSGSRSRYSTIVLASGRQVRVDRGPADFATLIRASNGLSDR